MLDVNYQIKTMASYSFFKLLEGYMEYKSLEIQNSHQQAGYPTAQEVLAIVIPDSFVLPESRTLNVIYLEQEEIVEDSSNSVDSM